MTTAIFDRYGRIQERPRPMKRHKKLSIREAAKTARRLGMLGDYYALDGDQQMNLRVLLQDTKWKPTRFQQAKGWSLLLLVSPGAQEVQGVRLSIEGENEGKGYVR